MTGRGRRWPAALAIVAGLAAPWLAGLVRFADAIPDPAPPDERETDAVVVLTGGSGRIEAGAELLAMGRGRKLFISGVSPRAEMGAVVGAHLPATLIECCVVLGRAAGSTRGNAAETARWMAAEGMGSIRLVTGAYHMPRSLEEFRRALPRALIVPHPVFPLHVKQRDWWRRPGTAGLIATEYAKYLASAALHALEGALGGALGRARGAAPGGAGS